MRQLLNRFNVGSSKPKKAPRQAPIDRSGLHLDGTTLYDGGRWVADFNDIGAAKAGLAVEQRRLAARKAG
jgi:hypothetical protein